MSWKRLFQREIAENSVFDKCTHQRRRLRACCGGADACSLGSYCFGLPFAKNIDESLLSFLELATDGLWNAPSLTSDRHVVSHLDAPNISHRLDGLPHLKLYMAGYLCIQCASSICLLMGQHCFSPGTHQRVVTFRNSIPIESFPRNYRTPKQSFFGNNFVRQN